MKLNFYICLSAITAVLTVGCQQRKAPYETCNGVVWHTSYNICFNNVDRVNNLADSITACLREVEMSLSPFNDSSLITAVNRSERPTKIDSRIKTVFECSQSINSLSGHAFDPTVSPLVNLWGFGYTDKNLDAPDETMIASALEKVGIGECSIKNDTLYKKHPLTEFNFSAITKGYGCDMAGEMLSRNGVTDYMIEIGGEIAVSGLNERGEKWHIMIDAPIESDSVVVHSRMAMIEVTDCGVATSGNYRNFRDFADGRHGHTISTVTGHPVESQMLSATVVAPTAMEADALATACMAMDADGAMHMISQIRNTEALIVVASEAEPGYQIIVSEGFPLAR